MAIFLVGLSSTSYSQDLLPPCTVYIQTIGEDCTCTGSEASFCETTPTIDYGISNVLYLFNYNGGTLAVKLDDYGGDIKDPTDPINYLDGIIAWLGQIDPPKIVSTGDLYAYYIKAGQYFYDGNGNEVTIPPELSIFMNRKGTTFGGKEVLVLTL